MLVSHSLIESGYAIEDADILPQQEGSDHCPSYADVRPIALSSSSSSSILVETDGGGDAPALYTCYLFSGSGATSGLQQKKIADLWSSVPKQPVLSASASSSPSALPVVAATRKRKAPAESITRHFAVKPSTSPTTSRSIKSESESPWPCSRCTFLNCEYDSKCAMCSSSRFCDEGLSSSSAAPAEVRGELAISSGKTSWDFLMDSNRPKELPLCSVR